MVRRCGHPWISNLWRTVENGVSFRIENFTLAWIAEFCLDRMAMARKARMEFAGAVYHVLDRGDRREAIFEDDTDRRAFSKRWARLVRGRAGGCMRMC